ncbi:hypothetical protein KSP39_PZI000527 [Platanthera zijinensis]|uniref:Dymeclin n=1 Tax=Platanthera zijinensis TaxID=2320716 RepID=A0AAP0C5Z3_9ASPA
MGAVPSTPRRGTPPADAAEELIGMFVGEKSYPISSDFWKKLLELPHSFGWPHDLVAQACQTFLQNNYHTRHLAKILIHMVLSLKESLSTASGYSAKSKAINAAYISSVFTKYIIENGKSGTFEELFLSLPENDMDMDALMGQSIENFVMHGVLNFIGTSDVSGHSYVLHHELLNFVLVAMSTQLRSGPSPGPNDVHPFIDAAMRQADDLVTFVVRRLLLNFIAASQIPFRASHTIYSNEDQSGVLQRVGSAAGTKKEELTGLLFLSIVGAVPIGGGEEEEKLFSRLVGIENEITKAYWSSLSVNSWSSTDRRRRRRGEIEL